MKYEIKKDIKVSGLYADIHELERTVPNSIYAIRVDHECQTQNKNFACIHLLDAASNSSADEIRFLENLRIVADARDSMVVIHCAEELLLTPTEANALGYHIKPVNNMPMLALDPKSLRNPESDNKIESSGKIVKQHPTMQ